MIAPRSSTGGLTRLELTLSFDVAIQINFSSPVLADRGLLEFAIVC